MTAKKDNGKIGCINGAHGHVTVLVGKIQPHGPPGVTGAVVVPRVGMEPKLDREHVQLKENVQEKVNKPANVIFLSVPPGHPGVPGAVVVPRVEMEPNLEPEHVPSLENVKGMGKKPTNVIFLNVLRVVV